MVEVEEDQFAEADVYIYIYLYIYISISSTLDFCLGAQRSECEGKWRGGIRGRGPGRKVNTC